MYCLTSCFCFVMCIVLVLYVSSGSLCDSQIFFSVLHFPPFIPLSLRQLLYLSLPTCLPHALSLPVFSFSPHICLCLCSPSSPPVSSSNTSCHYGQLLLWQAKAQSISISSQTSVRYTPTVPVCVSVTESWWHQCACTFSACVCATLVLFKFEH